MQKVIPPGLNYGDIKPEAIENQIRIVKFTPIATIQSAQANDIVRFHIQGNGFYDPYSAYIRIRIKINDPGNPNLNDDGTAMDPNAIDQWRFAGKFLDRSAHSLFSRLVIRSQGTELERIEQYDVMAAMINDVIYSQEQRILHHYEGFTHRQSPVVAAPTVGVAVNRQDHAQNIAMLPYILPQAAEPLQNRLGDVGHFRMGFPKQKQYKDFLQKIRYSQTGQIEENKLSTGDPFENANVVDVANGTTAEFIAFKGKGNDTQEFFGSFGGVTRQLADKYPIGLTTDGKPYTIEDQFSITHEAAVGQGALGTVNAGGYNKGNAVDLLNNGNAEIENGSVYEFCIPIYSGILGVLMPSKKLIPMSLLPLEVEFTMNPHAFYPVGKCKNRSYSVERFEIWSHTMFFEQELHRSLEAAVAESGVFLHYNSFYLAPVNTYNALASALPQYNQIGVFLKSINSVHWTFMYHSYEQEDGPRKLHFVSHNVTSLQLRNGMDLMPSEPIQGMVGGATASHSAVNNVHSPYLIETYKAWNKMHDPLSDAALTAFNYCVDHNLEKPTTMEDWLFQQMTLGTCQYGISLEGDELGTNKTMIGGKKSVMPFDINLSAKKSEAKTSYMMCFLRADFIIYVRPDLVVTRLGL